MTDQTFLERYKELMMLQENPEYIISKRAFNKELREADRKIEQAVKTLDKVNEVMKSCDMSIESIDEFIKIFQNQRKTVLKLVDYTMNECVYSEVQKALMKILEE